MCFHPTITDGSTSLALELPEGAAGPPFGGVPLLSGKYSRLNLIVEPYALAAIGSVTAINEARNTELPWAALAWPEGYEARQMASRPERQLSPVVRR